MLKKRFQDILDSYRSVAPRGGGYERFFGAYPAVEDRVKALLEEMRQRGAGVNIRIVRYVMQSVIEASAPQLLEHMKLSNGFISAWVREQLHWSWRMRTTAASKLPLDWQNQGVTMSKRIAYAMQIYKVSNAQNRYETERCSCGSDHMTL